MAHRGDGVHRGDLDAAGVLGMGDAADASQVAEVADAPRVLRAGGVQLQLPAPAAVGGAQALGRGDDEAAQTVIGVQDVVAGNVDDAVGPVVVAALEDEIAEELGMVAARRADERGADAGGRLVAEVVVDELERARGDLDDGARGVDVAAAHAQRLQSSQEVVAPVRLGALPARSLIAEARGVSVLFQTHPPRL